MTIQQQFKQGQHRHQDQHTWLIGRLLEARTSPIPTITRVAQHRARRRCGLRSFHFFGDEVEVLERLIEAECLASGDVDNEKAIRAALTRFFAGLKFI